MSRIQGHQNKWPGLAFVPKQLHLGLFFLQPAQEQKFTERSQINANKNLLLLQRVLPTMHRSVFHSRGVRVRSIGYRFKSIHWYNIIYTSMVLSCVHGDGCDFLFLSSVAEGFHATTSRFYPQASKLRNCSYWIFHKELFHCDSSNPEPFTAVMSYLSTMSTHF